MASIRVCLHGMLWHLQYLACCSIAVEFYGMGDSEGSFLDKVLSLELHFPGIVEMVVEKAQTVSTSIST